MAQHREIGELGDGIAYQPINADCGAFVTFKR
jgi:hypothetical protein